MKPGLSDKLIKKWFFVLLWTVGLLVFAAGVGVGVNVYMSGQVEVFEPAAVLAWLVGFVITMFVSGIVHDDETFIGLFVVLNLVFAAGIVTYTALVG